MKRLDALNFLGAASLVASFAFAAGAQSPLIAHADLKDKSGKAVGTADLTQTPGGVLIKLSVKDFKSGEHGVHIHAVGKCEPPFESAGPHVNPGSHKHGMLSGEGNAGDVPNVQVPEDGELGVEMPASHGSRDVGKTCSRL